METKRETDSQRAKLYRAEEPLKHAGVKFADLAEVVAYIEDLQRDPRMAEHAPAFATASLSYHNGGGARAASSRDDGCAWVGGKYVKCIRFQFPIWSRVEYVVLHEVAHAITDCQAAPRGISTKAGHGREFAANLLWLVRWRLGAKSERTLRESFAAAGVRYKPKREMTPAQREAAARGLAAMRAAKEA